MGCGCRVVSSRVSLFVVSLKFEIRMIRMWFCGRFCVISVVVLCFDGCSGSFSSLVVRLWCVGICLCSIWLFV